MGQVWQKGIHHLVGALLDMIAVVSHNKTLEHSIVWPG